MHTQLLVLLKRGGRLLVLSILFVTVSYVGFASAVEVGKFTYRGTPEELSDTTITVNDTMVAMSEYIYVGQPMQMDTTIDTPSIFFMIDNSGSMSTMGDMNDVNGNRFTVTSAFIDTIQKKFKKAEVGIAVFGTWLFFDPADSAYFVTCPAVANGAYVPLLELDKDYGGGRTGYQILKAILDTAVYNRNGMDYVDLKYQPTDSLLMGTSTHINACFEAAKHAFTNSVVNNGKNNKHYIIFLSDGDATYPTDGTQNDFEQGTDVATTFTVFFTQTSTVPASIATMTANIQTNGYSTISNPKSNYWGFANTTFEQLMQFLMDNVFTAINTGITSTPTQITIGGISVTNWDSTGFAFNNLFPLTGQITTFNYNITYSMYNANNVWIKDTTHVINNFNVEIDPAASTLPDTLDVRRWDRDLNFRFNNINITSANATMAQLEIQFINDTGTAGYNYSNAKVEVTHTQGSVKDKETFTLTGTTNSFSIAFARIIDSTPTPGNQILEHNAIDTLVATFRNSEPTQLPLDTLRIAIPFLLGDAVTIFQAEYYDLMHGPVAGADGLIDKIRLYVSGVTISQSHIDDLNNNKDVIVLPAFRNFTNNGFSLEGGNIIAIDVTEGNTIPVTNITDDDNLEVKLLVFTTEGYLSPGNMRIIDMVAPVIIDKVTLKDIQDATATDTLTVIFSEPVTDVASISPFYFLDSANSMQQYTANLQLAIANNETMVFGVTQINNGVTQISDGDSIYIQAGAYVVDLVGNNQDEGNNVRRRVYTEYILNPFVIDIIAINPYNINDLDPNNSIPDTIIVIIGDNINNFELDNINNNYFGLIIQVLPDSLENLHPDFDIEGELSIYDAVGNQIIGGKEMYKFNNTLIFIWNGRNLNKRKVGRGTYLAVCSITTYPRGKNEADVKNEVKRIMLGVKD